MTQWFRARDEGSTTHSDWSFEWTIDGHHEGLTLFNVRWKGTKVLHKASLPAIRVKYRGGGEGPFDGCGPFVDRIGGVKTDEYLKKRLGYEFEKEVKVAWRIWDELDMLEMFIFDQIGGYDLYQSWFFWPHARMEGRLGSAGWSCGEAPESRLDHHHHIYWRLDFDVETISNDLSLFITPQTGATFFFREILEGQSKRLSSEKLIGVEIRSLASQKHVRAYIDGNELRDTSGSPWFGFSNKDVAWRRYRSNEDNGWMWGFPESYTAGALEHLGLANPPDSIDHKDIVIWFVGHMSHHWPDHTANETHYRYLTIEPSW